jgi:dGTP triphosphohydrolase
VHLILESLLEHYSSVPPPPEATSPEGQEREKAVDYVAGMTDRFALRAYANLVGEPPPDVTALQ